MCVFEKRARARVCVSLCVHTCVCVCLYCVCVHVRVHARVYYYMDVLCVCVTCAPGILGGFPITPYANAGAMRNEARSPTLMPDTATSQPLMTRPWTRP